MCIKKEPFEVEGDPLKSVVLILQLWMFRTNDSKKAQGLIHLGILERYC